MRPDIRMHHVLLIEDDALVRMLLEKRLVEAGWQVTSLRDGRGMSEVMQGLQVDLVILDLGLPYIDGLALVEMLRGQGHLGPIMVLTAHELPHLFETVRDSGADSLLLKPYDQEELIRQAAALIAA